MRKKPAISRRVGRPRRVADHDGRRQLLDAAIALFAQRGIAATTVAAIAADAKVTPALLHYYFKNRAQLLDAVVDERLVPFISSVWDPVIECGDDPFAILA